MRLLSHNIHADDGVDARLFFSNESRRKDDVRALGRLRSTVERCVQEVLAGGLADPRLADVWVESVEPAPDGARFRAVVVVEPERSVDGVEAALANAAPLFRLALAATLQKKRTPLLVFRVIHGEVP